MSKISRRRPTPPPRPVSTLAFLARYFGKDERINQPLSIALRSMRARVEMERVAATLAPPETAPLGVDLDRPSWIGAMISHPALLTDENRARCEMLVGFSPIGAHPLDLAWIAKRSEAIFGETSREANIGQTTLRARLESTWAQGRIARAMIGYGLARSRSRAMACWEARVARSLFNPRRAARRKKTPTPSSWRIAYGPEADLFWRAGMSKPAEQADRFDNWTASLSAIAQAMSEAGALVCRCDGFYKTFPAALDDQALMERIDQEWLDPIRLEWALQSSARSAAPGHRTPSL